MEILHEAYDIMVGGYFGEKRTLLPISKQFFWRRLWQDMKRYFRGCTAVLEQNLQITNLRGYCNPSISQASTGDELM
jgi:hypothetical protein